MAQEFKAALRFLYEEFGDDMVDLGREVIANKLQAKESQSGDAAKKETTHESKKSQAASSGSDNGNTKEGDQSALEEEAEVETYYAETQNDESDIPNYYDADVFERQTISKLQGDAVVILNSADVANAVKDLILMAGEVRKFEEAQITVRTDIAAQRDIALANIEVQKAALMTYLDKSFDERKENFDRLFSVVDDALEKDNMQELALGLESIIKLADSSPFKNLESIEATASALANPDHEWDF